jgi:hypothetical protein
LISCFIENKQEKLLESVFTSEEFKKYVIPDVLSDTVHKIPKFMIQEGVSFYEQGNLIKLNKLTFLKIREDAIKKGLLDWGKAKFVKFVLLHAPDTKDQKDIGNYGVNIYIDYLGQQFMLFDVGLFKTPNEYRLIYIRGLWKM